MWKAVEPLPVRCTGLMTFALQQRADAIDTEPWHWRLAISKPPVSAVQLPRRIRSGQLKAL
jgi:hypothetical protein